MHNSSNLQARGLTVLRVVVGIVFLMHGGLKLFVWGFHGVTAFLTQVGIPFPNIAAVVLTIVELGGGAALVLGLLTRWVALLLALDMTVAILTVRLKGGFFSPNGFELELMLLASNIALILSGPGAAAIDSLIAKKRAVRST
jgi:putative oxidoreductase